MKYKKPAFNLNSGNLMAHRYLHAINATQTTELVQLAKFLTASVQEVLHEGALPFYDPAVQLIAFQIAFSANGDSTFLTRYDKVFHYCRQKVTEGPNGIFLQENTVVEPPVLQSS